MAFLFSLDLMKIAQEEKVIVDKEGNERGKYYVIGLSNGAKSFEVTCGEKNNLLKVPVFSKVRVHFDMYVLILGFLRVMYNSPFVGF